MKESGDKLIVIDFNAKWCGPCQKIKPVFESLPSKYENVRFLECDIDELEDLEELDDVSGVPTFRFLKGGKKVAEFSGANESKLINTIEQYK